MLFFWYKPKEVNENLYVFASGKYETFIFWMVVWDSLQFMSPMMDINRNQDYYLVKEKYQLKSLWHFYIEGKPARGNGGTITIWLIRRLRWSDQLFYQIKGKLDLIGDKTTDKIPQG